MGVVIVTYKCYKKKLNANELLICTRHSGGTSKQLRTGGECHDYKTPLNRKMTDSNGECIGIKASETQKQSRGQNSFSKQVCFTIKAEFTIILKAVIFFQMSC